MPTKKRTIEILDSNDNSSNSSHKKPKIINLDMYTKEKVQSKYDKLHPLLKKIILYASSDAIEESSPLQNYVELLNCTSNKTALLLYTTVATNERVPA